MVDSSRLQFQGGAETCFGACGRDSARFSSVGWCDTVNATAMLQLRRRNATPTKISTTLIEGATLDDETLGAENNGSHLPLLRIEERQNWGEWSLLPLEVQQTVAAGKLR